MFDISRLESLVEAGFTVLTPNFRLARRIKSEWDRRQTAAGRSLWQPLPVLPLQSWLQRSWRQALAGGAVPRKILLESARLNELWLQVIEADRAAHGEYSLLQPAQAAELASQARENLLRWRIPVSGEAVRSQFRLDPDCATFLRWLDRFESRLLAGGFATAEDCSTDLLTATRVPGADKLALVDFDDIAPLHLACLEQSAMELTRIDTGGDSAPVQVLAYPERQRELEAAAGWAAAQHREDPQRTIGIVLADMAGDRASLEYLLRREFDCLGENYASLPVNFSTGISLEQAPVVRDALSMLQACGTSLPLMLITALLRSRFTAHRDYASDCATRLLDLLYQEGREQVDTGRLRYLAQQVEVSGQQGTGLGQSLAAVAQLRLHRKRRLPSDWLEPLCQVLDLWGWPGPGPLDSLEYQQVEAWYQILERFAGYDQVSAELTFNEALQILRRCCQQQVSQPQTVDSNLQVLGTLEGAGLQFDVLWLCGVQGSRWPAPARPNPFIPQPLQQRHRMPHASSEREWQFAADLLQRYRCNCIEMTVSFSRHLEGVPELPSPLLAQFPLQEVEGGASVALAWLSQWREGELESLADRQALAVDEEERADLAGGSAILQDQAACPFRAFARRRLDLQPLAEYRVGLSAAERGSILHDALYALWGEIGDSEHLSAMDSGALDSLLSESIAGALRELPAAVRESAGQHCLELEQRRLRVLLQEWLQLERLRPPFAVIARERDLEFELAGLPLKLRVDRVDELGDGSSMVIDYKSGRNSLADWLGERPAQPQLPLYGIATEVSALAFAEVRARECRIQGIGEVESVPGIQDDIPKAVKRYSDAQTWQELQAQWQGNLEKLAGQFLAGESAVDPLKGACRYCGLQPLCRVELAGEQA